MHREYGLAQQMDSMSQTYHLPLLQLGDIILKNELPFRFNLGLLPNRMLREELVCRWECRVMEYIGVALEHIPDCRSQF